MAKGKGSSSSATGLLGNLHTGVFGVINCDSKDDSFYCKFSKIFSMIMMVLTLCIIAFLIYTFVKPYIFKKSGIFRKIK